MYSVLKGDMWGSSVVCPCTVASLVVNPIKASGMILYLLGERKFNTVAGLSVYSTGG